MAAGISSTPLISKRRSMSKLDPKAPILTTRLHLRPAPDRYWRLKLALLVFASILFTLSMLTFDSTLGESLASIPRSYVSSIRYLIHSTSSSSSNKITQVTTLPRHLIPKTYVHHALTNRRLVVVGDVHGAHSELSELLSRISFNASNDHLILAGDMIDKGPSSHAVISLARSLGASGVRGNHEDTILKLRDALDADPSSVTNHGSRQLDVAKELSKKDIEWLKQCPLILRIGQLPGHRQKETVVVHAGLLPLVGLDKQDPFDVMHMRSISRLTGKGKQHRKHDRKHSKVQFRAYEDRHEGDEPWWKVWNQVQTRLKHDERTLVIYGHDSHTGFIEQDWSVGLDSGCVSGGKLSALIIEGEDEKTGEVRTKMESVKCEKYR